MRLCLLLRQWGMVAALLLATVSQIASIPAVTAAEI